MEEKKNISFVSGLALLLAILALVLVAWSGIGGDITPYQTEYKSFVENKLESLSNRVDLLSLEVERLNDSASNGRMDWQVYKLQELQNALAALGTHSVPEFKAELTALQQQIGALAAKIKAAKFAAIGAKNATESPLTEQGGQPGKK